MFVVEIFVRGEEERRAIKNNRRYSRDHTLGYTRIVVLPKRELSHEIKNRLR